MEVRNWQQTYEPTAIFIFFSYHFITSVYVDWILSRSDGLQRPKSDFSVSDCSFIFLISRLSALILDVIFLTLVFEILDLHFPEEYICLF